MPTRFPTPTPPGEGGRKASESVAGFTRNGWPNNFGIGGRLQPEYPRKSPPSGRATHQTWWLAETHHPQDHHPPTPRRTLAAGVVPDSKGAATTAQLARVSNNEISTGELDRYGTSDPTNATSKTTTGPTTALCPRTPPAGRPHVRIDATWPPELPSTHPNGLKTATYKTLMNNAG